MDDVCVTAMSQSIPNALSTDGLAWDWVNSKLYWTDAEDNDIEVIDTVTTHRKLLISTGNTTTPRALVLDPQNK